jgi:hypothetical protein
MTATDAETAKIAAKLAARLNRPDSGGSGKYSFQIIEESFAVLDRRELPGGRIQYDFEFQGLIRHEDEPVAYQAAGTLVIGPDGEIEPDGIVF